MTNTQLTENERVQLEDTVARLSLRVERETNEDSKNDLLERLDLLQQCENGNLDFKDVQEVVEEW